MNLRAPAAPPSKARRLAGILALALTLALFGGLLRARQYTRTDPRFCAASCHTPKEGAGAWHTSGHLDLACQKCHVTSDTAGLRMLWDEVFDASKTHAPHASVPIEGCISCHDKKPAEWRRIQDTEGHRGHRGLKDVNCLSCHGPTAHSQISGEERICLDCHQEQRLHTSAVGAETCLSCHNFATSEKLAQGSPTRACETCHADPARMSASVLGASHVPSKTIEPAVLHGRLDCKLCHDPHGNQRATPKGQPECARCHQMQLFVTGADADRKPKGPEAHFACEGCHKPHAPRKQALDSCADCHASRVRGATPSGTKATTALQHESCASCHMPHTWVAELRGCVQCHEAEAQGIKNESPKEHAQCTTCHAVHGAPPSGEVCQGCHTNKKGHVAVAPERHKDCLSCHNPHGASRQAAKNACASCHLTELTSFASGPPRHVGNGCVGCHKPHESPRPEEAVCSKCHDDKAKVVATAGPPKHKNCASCHEPHKFTIEEPKAACEKCHTGVIRAGEGPHQGECKSCHTLHGPPQIAKAACFGCHKKIEAAFKAPPGKGAEPHNRCKSCHEPHRAAAAAPAKCQSCHERPAAAASTWPAGSPHADACNKCHTPHDVREKKTCASCHQAEAESAKRGKHTCVQCHKPHEPTPGKGPAWWGRCVQCHDAKVATAKERGPTHAACQSCHKPHEFTPPTCLSCHADAPKKGVHAVKAHNEKCSSCHDPHVKAEPTRKQCLTCHTNKQSHEPTAERCYACHPFK